MVLVVPAYLEYYTILFHIFKTAECLNTYTPVLYCFNGLVRLISVISITLRMKTLSL